MYSTWRARVRQFLAAGDTRAPAPSLDRLDAYLSPVGRQLFLSQRPFEQRHAIALGKALLAVQPDAPCHLIEAALLHDLGKVEADVRRWQRVAFVLLTALAPWLLQRLADPIPDSHRHVLWVLQHHAALGADLAQAQGVDARTVWLIRHHHDHLDDAELRLLRRVDEGEAPTDCLA